MKYILSLIGSTLLVALSGAADTLITAPDYAVNSDVVLESAVRDIKSAPQDAVNVVGDGVKYVADEVSTASRAIASVFEEDPSGNTKKKGILETADAWDSSNNILFRSYGVSGEIGSLLMSAANKTGSESLFVDVSGFFRGVEFPEKSSAYYSSEYHTLFVHQTQSNIMAIEDVLAGYQKARHELLGNQVEIEAKFVEVGQKTLNELGFNWSFGSKNGGDMHLFDSLYLPAGSDLFGGALRTASQALNTGSSAGSVLISKTAGSLRWDLMISALEQSDGADVLSAPRVVTRDGSTAVIQVGEEQMLPKSFEVDNRSTSPWVLPDDWNQELIGVKLEVTPQLREDGLIDLKIAPEVKDIIGYDSYQLVPEYTDKHNNDTLTSELNGSLPYYRIRKMESRVTVADGSTVGMGGLIYDKQETFRDKVPVLGSIPFIGRFFRSEGERSVKRNLMIFVTAAQVDVKGRKVADLALKK